MTTDFESYPTGNHTDECFRSEDPDEECSSGCNGIYDEVAALRAFLAEAKREHQSAVEREAGNFEEVKALRARLTLSEGLLGRTAHSWSASLADEVETFLAESAPAAEVKPPTRREELERRVRLATPLVEAGRVSEAVDVLAGAPLPPEPAAQPKCTECGGPHDVDSGSHCPTRGLGTDELASKLNSILAPMGIHARHIGDPKVSPPRPDGYRCGVSACWCSR